MALVRQCDRCGEIFEQDTKGSLNGIVPIHIKYNSETAFEYKTRDIKTLCPNCLKEYEAWFYEHDKYFAFKESKE